MSLHSSKLWHTKNCGLEQMGWRGNGWERVCQSPCSEGSSEWFEKDRRFTAKASEGVTQNLFHWGCPSSQVPHGSELFLSYSCGERGLQLYFHLSLGSQNWPTNRKTYLLCSRTCTTFTFHTSCLTLPQDPDVVSSSLYSPYLPP